MVNKEIFSIKNLLLELDWDTPYSTKDLAVLGLRPTHAARLASVGWLKRIGRGVYQIPNGTLNREKAIAFLSSQLTNLHIGGKTALEWRGSRQNLAYEDRLVLWGQKTGQLPKWFSTLCKFNYQSTNIFDLQMDAEYGLAPLPAGNPKVMVSVPERALLELFSDTGKLQSSDETLQIAESVRNVRLDVLDKLLAHTTRVKVVRLAKSIAEDLDLPWLSIAQKHNSRLGSDSRWIAVTRDKKILSLKK